VRVTVRLSEAGGSDAKDAGRSRRSREPTGEGEGARRGRRGSGSERCCGRYDARLEGSDAEGAAGFDDEPGVCSRRWRECCRGAEGERSAYDGGRAQAADDAAGSDAEEPVLRGRRLAWPEASTADRGRGSHFSRSGPETNERIAKGDPSASGALAECKRCTGRSLSRQ
jgi:hypothetical protein